MWGKVFSAAAAACLLTIGAAGFAHAMNVSPIQVEMTSAGGQSRNQVTVTNTGATPMPVETTLEKLQLDENGRKKMSKAGDNFLIFPPQAMIPPGGKQVFRIQWVGDPAIAASESYQLTISQVPVKLPKGQSQVQVVMGFGVVLNVAPAGATPSLTVIGSSLVKDKQGKRHAMLLVENPTNMHALLPDGTINVSGEGWSQTLSAAEIREKMGIGLVQPGMKRRFILPVTVPTSVTNLQVSFDYHPKH